MKTWHLNLLAILITCTTTNPATARLSQTPAQAVTSTTVQSTVQQRSLSALGTLRANQSVNISPRIAGQIVNLGIDDGKTVTKGDVLVKLDSREQQSKVNEVRIEMNDADRKLKTMKTLYARKAISKDEFDAQTAVVQRLKATLESQIVNLDYHTIKAPFSGVLGFSDISQGELVTNNEVITTLDDLSKMKLSFELPENTLRFISPGTQVIAQTNNWPDQKFVGTVSAINPRIDTTNLTFTSLAVINNKDHKLRPGMPVRITIMQPPQESIVIPARSVLFDGNQQYVYVIDDQNKTSKRFITVGQATDTSITVLDGLESGERIIDQGVIKAKDGAKVRIVGDYTANTNKEYRS